jgi:outer membrane protein, multidrug efflux system
MARRARLRSRILLLAALCLGTPACLVGPDYRRPETAPPPSFRGGGAPASATSLGDAKWFDVFQDPQLQSLIRIALEYNDDVRRAAARILQAQAQLGVTRADQFPTVTAGIDVLGQRPSVALGFPSKNAGAVVALGSTSWEIDFWGRYRRATEAARATLAGAEWAQRAVVSTLVSQIADGYFALRALDLELDISKRTLASRQESLRLTQVREQGGATSLVDVRQAEQLVYQATGEIATLERQIEQQENFLSVLVGADPGPIDRGLALTEQPHAPDVPAGLPSALIGRRPDIQEAEQQLIAANAQIGVARAALFPDVALTVAGGFESTALMALFNPTNFVWNAAASATEAIFNGGRNRSRIALAEAQRQEMVVNYEHAIRQGFLEVSDALVGYRKLREFREQQTLLTSSAQDGRRLAQIRYEGGATSYLEVLDADTRLFAAQLGLAEAQLAELNGLVELYRALGGGWS